jgi:hypothetical protein
MPAPQLWPHQVPLPRQVLWLLQPPVPRQALLPPQVPPQVLARIIDDQQPNQDIGIKRLHARALRLRWRFACQRAKRDRPRTAE